MTTAEQAQRNQERVDALLVRILHSLADEHTPEALWAAVTEGLSDDAKDFWGVSSQVMIAKEFRWMYLKHFETFPMLRKWNESAARSTHDGERCDGGVRSSVEDRELGR